MYPSPQKQIIDINTITWHNLHFILEHYTGEILTILEEIIVQGENQKDNDDKTVDITANTKVLLETKAEVISTIKTLKAMHTVIEHHRAISNLRKEKQQ